MIFSPEIASSETGSFIFATEYDAGPLTQAKYDALKDEMAELRALITALNS